ncbi:uncharacterized protein KD926_006936 [Aspergillus affinis]|uniref:uncharacterized protein n=1 Tax=Aspergillus affinis TaxID=1070780 RepID=UPI0022FF16BA|nr:uncharacterized protein KD926_006936 [Aspergillus affinis]KAI9041360.1 hypothetical protein KD926_006936 [Aspergillus affinis]
MSRLSRHLLNFTLLLIAVSGQFNLTDFIEAIRLEKDPQKIVFIVYRTVLNIVLYILINGIRNIRGLGSPVKGVFIAVLWLTSGYPCDFRDNLYEVYHSGPSDGITGRLWHLISAPEHVISYIVVGFSVFRLISQWGVFLYFFKTHESPDVMKPKKRNCTTIIATTDTDRQRVEECLTSCLLNKVREAIVVTTNSEFAETEDMVNRFRKCFPETTIYLLDTEETRKCDMISEAIKMVETDIVVLVDPNVFWPRRFLDRLLVSFNNIIGFAMIYQPVHRFRMSLRVSSRGENTQQEPRMGLSLGQYAARAIACPKSLLQQPEFSGSFKQAQPTDSAFYDEECAARFLERWALENGYRTAKSYVGHDAFEPPLRTTPESAVFAHRLFYYVKCARQAARMRFRNILNIAIEWGNLTSVARSSHALAFLILAFCLDAALTMIIWQSTQKKREAQNTRGRAH